jgi:hypothetical protein
MAFSSGVPIDPSGASMSAPASISAAATSTSSLLAAQCSGVSVCQLPSIAAFGSAPAQLFHGLDLAGLDRLDEAPGERFVFEQSQRAHRGGR